MTRYDSYQQAQQSLYENVRLTMSIMKIDRTGAINPKDIRATFSDFILHSVQEQGSEKIQIVLASDAPKLYTFGTQHKFYTYQGTVLDTELTSDVQAVSGIFLKKWTGRGYKEWKTFYELGNIPACARSRTTVCMTYGSRKVYGAFSQMSASADANKPNEYDVVFSFYVTHEEEIYVE